MENNSLSALALLSKAMQLIKANPDKEFCRISWLQRELRIGHIKGCELHDLLTEKGFVEEITCKILRGEKHGN